jgi:hypothetical protein
MLSLEASIRNVQRIGIPVYAMAYGGALKDSALLGRLKKISQSTGGAHFQVREPGDIAGVFDRIAQDLEHVYLLGYNSNTGGGAQWRTVKVSLPGYPKMKLRAKEGYWP